MVIECKMCGKSCEEIEDSQGKIRSRYYIDFQDNDYYDLCKNCRDYLLSHMIEKM